MRGRLGTRAVQYGVLIFLTVALNFFLPRAMPGSPLAYLAGEDVGLMSAEVRREVLARHALDLPLGTQFARYLGNLVRGDLGHSYQRGRPVAEIIAERLPWTLLLTATSLVLSTLIGVALGAWAAWRRGQSSDLSLLLVVMFFRSMPSFWIAVILVAVFAVGLGWFPIYGAYTPWLVATGWERVLNVLRHLALPVLSLTLIGSAETFLVMRYAMLDVLGEDYIATARAKGLSERVVLYKHALRNALLPVATVFMLNLGFTVSGATVIETVFAYPGLGRLMYEAVLSRDYPLLQASFLVVTLAVVLANLLADLLYPLLDPRVRLSDGA